MGFWRVAAGPTSVGARPLLKSGDDKAAAAPGRASLNLHLERSSYMMLALYGRNGSF